MPLDRAVLEEHLARVNSARRADQRVEIVAWTPQRFTLRYPNRALPEGQCIDQDFTEIQWALHESVKIDTGIVGGRHAEDDDRYYMEYEVIEWD